MRYDRAHELATVGEHLEINAAKQNWTAYKNQIGRVVRQDEKQGSKKLPKDFDHGPQTESQ
jgi:hypothetical protein